MTDTDACEQAVLREREACAVRLEQAANNWDIPGYSFGDGLRDIARAIRSRRTPSPSGEARIPEPDAYQPADRSRTPAGEGVRIEPLSSGSGTEADSRAAFARHMRTLAEHMALSFDRDAINDALDRFEANTGRET